MAKKNNEDPPKEFKKKPKHKKMEPYNSKELEVPPEPLLNTIYY